MRMRCRARALRPRAILDGVIGADRQPEFPDWRVRISDGVAPIYLNVRIATLFEADLRRVRETGLADHGQVSASSDTLV